MNPQDLTGRDLDLAVTKRLGYVWWRSPTITERRRHDCPPPESWGCERVDDPGSCDLPGYDCDGGRIPEMFAEIAKAVPPTSNVTLWRSHNGQFCATARGAGSTGSTPNEALARLLLMVTQQ